MHMPAVASLPRLIPCFCLLRWPAPTVASQYLNSKSCNPTVQWWGHLGVLGQTVEREGKRS